MKLSDIERKTLVDLYWSKSMETFEDARQSRAKGRWNNTANRRYYTMFHALNALFVKDGITVGTHRGVKAAVGQHYVLKGLISVEDAHLISRMETMRDRADYDCAFVATESQINELFAQIESFLPRIKELVDTTRE